MSTKNFRVSDGDWICPDKKCGNVNFARRTSCNRCGREKTTEAKMMKAGGTEIGKTLAEKSRGLFSANDWQCKTCGNVNWARRSECNMCNTPKYAKLEERTGYGGGFNERENVEYIEREESDGEYDEFGRKKKKYRGKPVGPASILKEVEDKESEGEDEEDEDEDLSKYKLDEDEDEDDADLSKYNLDASEEEDTNKKKKSNRRSRSKSRSSHSRSSSRSSSHSSSRSRSSFCFKMYCDGAGRVGGNCHFLSDTRPNGPTQEALPVPDQDLVPVPENTLDLVGRNQDPAPGPTGGLPPQEKDLTQALAHHLPPREARSEVVLDPLHLVIAKKDDRDHGHPKDAADHHLDLPILVPVQVLKRNNVLKLTFKKKKKKIQSVHETFRRSWCLTWSEVLNLLVEVHVCPCFLENCSFVHS
ncbi:zinc finger Ran-binding domain-containing protein 2 isoform 1-T1 [Leptosomus discolor]